MSANAPETLSHRRGGDEIKSGGLSVEEAHLNRGQIWSENSSEFSIPIKNAGTQSIRIDRFSVPCSECVSIFPQSLELRPGESKHIVLKTRVSSLHIGKIEQPIRPFDIDLSPIVAGSRGSNPVWRVHGLAKCRVTLSSTHLHFGDTSAMTDYDIERIVRARVHVGTKRVSAEIRPAQIATAEIIREADQSDFKIIVRLNRSLQMGTFQAKLLLTIIDEFGERKFGCEIPIEGRVVEPIQPCPHYVSFGLVPIGARVSEVVCFPGASELGVRVVHCESTFNDVVARPLLLPLIGRFYAACVIEWKVRQLGGWESQVTCQLCDSQGRVFERRLKCGGQGVLPRIPWIQSR